MAIVDINMPGLNGIRAINILHKKGVHTRFIINTAYGEFEYVKKALDMKVDGYLVKQGTYEENVKTIQKFLDIVKQGKEGWVCDVMQLVAAQMKKATGIEYRVGLGNIYETFDKMSLSYHESMEALQNVKREGILQKDAKQDNKVSIYVERAIQYIENHYSEDISLEMVAEQIKISSYYLSRLMKLEAGVTFTEYLTNVRMKEAVRLSVETMLPLKEIAERCGYYNITYFCKVFKKQTGKTISEYRRNL